MRSLFVVVPLLVALVSCGPSKEAATPSAGAKETKPLMSTVKLLTLNAAHTVKDRTEAKRFAAWVKSTGAEIVAVQQIERPQEGEKGFDAVAEVARATDMYQFFGKARFYEGFDSGNAVFSLYPIHQTTVLPLPVGKGKVRRSLAYGAIDVGLRTIGVASTELDDQSPADRIDEAAKIAEIGSSLRDFPFVVCGEFNERFKGKVAAAMMERFTAANSLEGTTVSLGQHVYTWTGSSVVPVAARVVHHGRLEGMIVTLQVTE